MRGILLNSCNRKLVKFAGYKTGDKVKVMIQKQEEVPDKVEPSE